MALREVAMDVVDREAREIGAASIKNFPSAYPLPNAQLAALFAQLAGIAGSSAEKPSHITQDADLRMIDVARDSSLTGEQVGSSWFPEVVASFFGNELPGSVHEEVKTAGVICDLTGFQLKVTVPPGETYIVSTRQQCKYTNGQETRGLGTTVYETVPAAGHSAIFWALSRDRRSGFGNGHVNGVEVFAWRFDGNPDGSDDVYIPRTAWSNQELLINPDLELKIPNFQAPQINRLRMLYLGFGPLVHELRNIKVKEIDPWAIQHAMHFINDPTRLQPNLSDANLGLCLEIRNTGVGDCIVRTNSWGIGPVLGGIGEQQPDGDRIFPRADGVAVDITGTPAMFSEVLPASAVRETGVIDSDGHNQIEIFIETDQVSAGDGVKIYYTDNANADVIHYSPPIVFTITAEDVVQGFAVFPVSVNMDGFKVSYKNGGFPANWRMVITMRKPSRPLAQRMMTGQVQLTDPGVINWSRAFGFTDAKIFKAPPVHDDGWQRFSVKAHETTTPIRGSLGFTGGAVALTATPAKIIDITNIPSGALGVQLQAASGNSKEVLLSFSSVTCNSTDCPGELSAGQPMYIDFREGLTTDVWAAMSTGTGRVRYWWNFGGGV